MLTITSVTIDLNSPEKQKTQCQELQGSRNKVVAFLGQDSTRSKIMINLLSPTASRGIVINRARILMTCHLSFLER